MSQHQFDIIANQADEIKRYKEVVFGLSIVIGALTTLLLGVALLTYYAYYHLS